MSLSGALFHQYPFIFILNWLAELLVLLAFFKLSAPGRILGVSLLLNLATHPILWFCLLKVPGPYLLKLFLAEALVASIEISLGLYLLKEIGGRRRIALGILAANALTFSMTFIA